MPYIDSPRFPEALSYGSSGGPEWQTDVVVVDNGAEQRTARWSKARRSYDAAHSLKNPAQMAELLRFFHIAQGRRNTFRFKDWADFQVSHAEGVVGEGYTNGQAVQALYKRYILGTNFHDRRITKPLAGLELRIAGVTAEVGTDYTLNTTTGEVTLVGANVATLDATSSVGISAISKANPGVVTTLVDHPFETGDLVRLGDITGMTQLNGVYVTVTVVAVNQFSIGVNTSAYTTYTSGGTAAKLPATQTNPVRIYAAAHGRTAGEIVSFSGVAGMTQLNGGYFTLTNVTTDSFDLLATDGTAFGLHTSGGTVVMYPQGGDTLTWAGEFDVHARFDTDSMKLNCEFYNAYSWGQIPVIEVLNE